jgi:hypothetical protein
VPASFKDTPLLPAHAEALSQSAALAVSARIVIDVICNGRVLSNNMPFDEARRVRGIECRMSEDVRSYLKTVAIMLGIAFVLLVAWFALNAFAGRATTLVAVGQVGLAVAAAAVLTAALSGFLVVYRARRVATGRGDLFLALNARKSDPAFLAPGGARPARLKGLRRLLGAPSFLVGDQVRVKSLSEIKATLDASGRLEGMPFMPEMERFCGRQARVFRVVDKVYDYGGKKNFRRMRNAVLLHDLRCEGSAHGACQAACYLFWKTAWLTPATDDSSPPLARVGAESRPAHDRGVAAAGSATYTCQFTEVVASSEPLSAWDIRQDLRPLIAGNLTVLAFLTTVVTLLFNAAQKVRGGIAFPWRRVGTANDSASAELELRVGERVRVRSADEIASTLNKRGRNKGLWFDRDQLKRIGECYTVRARVERIIDDATGKLLPMRTPCIILDGLYASGEFMRFCAQHDYMYWREAWLARVDEEAARRGPGSG